MKRTGMNHPSAACGKAPMKRDNKGSTLKPCGVNQLAPEHERQALRILTSSDQDNKSGGCGDNA
jgi:hypothetical protein